MVPRRGRKTEGGRGDEGRAPGHWPNNRKGEAARLAGQGRGVSSLHPPFHLHTLELVSELILRG